MSSTPSQTWADTLRRRKTHICNLKGLDDPEKSKEFLENWRIQARWAYTKGERISVSIHEMVSAEQYQLCLDTFYTALPHYQRLHIKLSLQIWD